jgi:hypothetical protein
MDVAVFDTDAAGRIAANQTGLHRLLLMPLIDGRWFVFADVLEETEGGIFDRALEGFDYAVMSYSEIEDMIPAVEPYDMVFEEHAETSENAT